MIAYFDTSAIFPLVVEESSSAVCHRIWDTADRVVTVELAYVEAAAALARAERADRLGSRGYQRAMSELDDYWASLDIIELDRQLSRSAAELARSQALRGYDAVHCAAATFAASDELVAVSGDRELLAAWAALGMPTVDINEP